MWVMKSIKKYTGFQRPKVLDQVQYEKFQTLKCVVCLRPIYWRNKLKTEALSELRIISQNQRINNDKTKGVNTEG